jgi:hypothetical protein
LDQITSTQLSEWEAYDKIDPVGSWRDDYRIAVLDSLIVNIVSKLYAKKGYSPKEVLPTDFMPSWAGEKRIEQKQSVTDMKQVLMSIAAVANKKEDSDKLDIMRLKRPPMAFKSRPPIRKPIKDQ